ncbi:MAG: DUF2723 domain-containing protein [Chloroflexota bacterium]|nr:DUF2723 domain-containing protein [Chloroflexota bacterium]
MPFEHKAKDSSRSPLRNLLQRPTLLAAGISLASLSLYVATLAPGLLWGGGDFAIFQTRAFSCEIFEDGPFGHSLWVILAHPFTRLPIRDVAWRANFAAAVFGAVALWFVFLSAWYITRSKVASLLATGTLAISHTFWTYAVMPKVYSLNALILAVCSYLLLRWREKAQDVWLYLFAFLYGLSFLNHLVMATAAAGFVVFVGYVLWSRRPSKAAWRSLLLAGFSFGLGLAPYLYLTIQSGSAQATERSILAFPRGLLYALFHPAALLNGAGWGVALLVYQFPITVFVGLVGLYYLWRQDRGTAAFVTLAVLGTFAFLLAAVDPRAGGVYVWNLHYYLQAYVIFAFALAAGFKVLWTRWCAHNLHRQATIIALSVILPVLVYAVAPSVASMFWQNVPDFRPLPGRDNLTYVLAPWKHHETGARDLGDEILLTLPPHSVLFADYSIWAIVNYLQVVEGARPDVELVGLPKRGRQVPLLLQYRDVSDLFLADTYRYYDVEEIQEYFEIVPEGPIYRLIPE